jgi:hypothetical protein
MTGKKSWMEVSEYSNAKYVVPHHRVCVEILILPKSCKDQALLKARFLRKPRIVSDGPSICTNLFGLYAFGPISDVLDSKDVEHTNSGCEFLHTRIRSYSYFC